MSYKQTSPIPIVEGGTGATTLTDHGVLVGSGTSAITPLSVGTDGQVLLGASAADPAFATLTSTGGTISFTPGAHTLNLETAGSIPATFAADSGTATPALGVITFAGGNNLVSSASGSTVTFDLNGTTNHAVQIGNSGGSLNSLTVGTNGQVLVGASAADPAFATLTSTGGTIAFTTGANTLNLETSGSISTTFAADSGTATPALGVITLAGGTNLVSSASGSTVTFDLNGTTDHAIQLGNSGGSLTSLSLGLAGQVLQSGGASANPAWSTATYPATVAQGDIFYGSATNVISDLAKDTNATRYLSNTGTSNNPAWAQVNLSNGVTNTLTVSNGGTGLGTITAHSVLVGEGTSAITPLAVGTDGQVLVGATGADPAFTTLTSTGGSITFTPGAHTLNLEAAATAFVYTEVTGTSATMAVNNGYIASNVGLVTLTLPATAALGSIIQVVGKGSGGWSVIQNSGQTIHFGSLNTTTTTGSLSSTVRYDCISLICTTANTDFVVFNSMGNITVV